MSPGNEPDLQRTKRAVKTHDRDRLHVREDADTEPPAIALLNHSNKLLCTVAVRESTLCRGDVDFLAQY